MNNQVPLKAIVTVTEMARMCGLSRARFCQLIKEGIFPTPSRNQATGRPFYDQDQQGECLQVRRTNLGVNGKPVIFYGLRVAGTPTPSSKSPRRSQGKPAQDNNRDATIEELRHGLKQLGMDGINNQQIRAALNQAYPDGYKAIPTSDLLGAVFVALQQLKEAS